MLNKLLAKAEELDWSYNICTEEYTGRSYVELEKYSPEGEDFIMTIEFDKGDEVDSFLEDLKEYADDFDVDEHVEMWIPSRGKGGCPSSIFDLLVDAKAIKDMIYELYDELVEIKED